MSVNWKDILMSSQGDEITTKQIYKDLRYNEDGSDRIKCFYAGLVRGKLKNKIGIDEITSLYGERLWKAILKYSSNERNKELGEKLHTIFSNFVWIGIHKGYLDLVYDVIGSYKRQSRKKVDFKRSVINCDSVFLDNFLFVDDHEIFLNYLIHIERLNQLGVILERRKYWYDVIKLVLNGFSSKQISNSLSISTTTVYSIIKKLTVLFNAINDAELSY